MDYCGGGISTVFYKSTRVYEEVIEARKNIKNAISQTKDGKMNTLVRIVKASTPDLSKIEVSQDDRMDAKLDKIYNELRRINRQDLFNSSISVEPVQPTKKEISDSASGMDAFLEKLARIAQVPDEIIKVNDVMEE